MKTLLVSVFLFVCTAGSVRAGNCVSPCIASYRCGPLGIPESNTCAVEDSCLFVNGKDFTRTLFSVPGTRLESHSGATGSSVLSLVRVSDSIRARGGSGAPVQLVLELDVTLERFEPESGGGALAGADLEVPGYRGLGFVTPASGVPGHQVAQKTLRIISPIVPDGEPVVVEWSVESSAAGGGTGSAIASWRVSTNDPLVVLEHCRDLTVPARTTSWGAVKSIYRV
jgi:hypothetical protein